MSNKQTVVVIGAGVIGLNVAWRLAERGASVTMVEAAQPGNGTSSTSFAWLNASSKVDAIPAYFDLNAQALREHVVLASRIGGTPWAHFTGDIEVAPGAMAADALARKVERLVASGYVAEMLSTEALAVMEPGTRMPTDGAAAYYAAEGWIDVGRFVDRLLALCRLGGVTVAPADPAQEVVQTGRGVAGVRLASGKMMEADAVVTALGRWTSVFAASLGLEVPLVAPEPAGSKAVGLLVRVRPVTGSPQRILHSPTINWSPLADGIAHLASDPGDATVARDRSPATIQAAARDLIREATILNPLFAGAAVEDARIGLRALPSDGMTVCGWARDVPGLYIVVTHSGVTLSPLLGDLVAHEIVDGRDAPILRCFRPDRFLAAR